MPSQPMAFTPADVWRLHDATEQRLTASLSLRMLDLAGLLPGMRVLDLATGRGEPAIPAAHRVGPLGRVVGVDPGAGVLEMTRERAEREGLTNLELHCLPAERLGDLGLTGFHATLVRWGLMYMDAPVTALIQARRAMRPDGVLVAALWAEPERVNYVSLPRQLFGRHCKLPSVDLEAPGVFRFAHLERVQRDLGAAGFHVDRVEECALEVMEARSAAELVAWTRTFGMDRLLAGLPQQTQQAWETDMATQFNLLQQDGVARLGGVTRVVVASINQSNGQPPNYPLV